MVWQYYMRYVKTMVNRYGIYQFCVMFVVFYTEESNIPALSMRPASNGVWIRQTRDITSNVLHPRDVKPRNQTSHPNKFVASSI